MTAFRPSAIGTTDRSRRVMIMHEVGAIVDAVLGLNDQTAAANLVRGAAKTIARDGMADGGVRRGELVTLAAYALAEVERLDRQAAH